MPAFIGDSYSASAVIPALVGQYEAVRVRFRPCLAEERLEWRSSIRGLGGKAQVAWIVRLLKDHVDSWNILDSTGKPVSITTSNLAQLHPDVLEKILDLVLGYSPAEEEADAKN